MRRRIAGKAAATGDGGVDRLGALPDEILQHALSFLPSRDAVRTCVLARLWRHLWKSAPALRVTDVDAFRSARHVNGFVNHLIVLRDRTPLREREIAVYKEYDGGGYYDSNGDRLEHSQYIDLWVRYTLSCHARLLRISDHDPNDLDAGYYDYKIRSVMLDVPILSGHLTTLELDGVVLSSECSHPLDFSSCPNLETLKMNRCSILFLGGDRSMNISSQSVRCLSITRCDFDHFVRARALISIPTLVHLDLELTEDCGLVPAFESMMPSLLTTSIKLDRSCNKDDMGCSLLLGCLSHSSNLDLMAGPQADSFKTVHHI
ncbi:FBD-associated F-box protein At5g56370-like [Aegilops tauschii subsp. strangulata]|uniref:FBD-associated F-box protein At5g56370-like n=1 Tax=Aegilops tauschii subsp. strangulata TaxID=200361 RepID=UPI000989EF13